MRTITSIIFYFLLCSAALADGLGRFEIMCIYNPMGGTIYNNKRYFEIDEAANRVDGFVASMNQKEFVWSGSNSSEWRIDRLRGRFSVTRSGILIADGPCQRVDSKKF